MTVINIIALYLVLSTSNLTLDTTLDGVLGYVPGLCVAPLQALPVQVCTN